MDIEKLKLAAEFHLKRGDSMQMDPKVVLELCGRGEVGENKQAEPVAWEVVFNAVKQAIELCKSATGQHFKISRYVNAVQITHDALKTDSTRPAPAVAQEPVDLRELFERLLFGTYAGKDSYYNEEQIKHGCFEKAQELADVAKRMDIMLYTEAPAVAVNGHVNETPKNEHDSDDVLTKAGNVDTPQMVPIKESLTYWKAVQELVDAALNMVDVKGRHHSELAMNRLLEAAKNYRGKS